MTQIDFGEHVCRRVQAQLDAYLDNELLTESSLEMVEHFRRCTPCAREAEARRNVRNRLQTAVREVSIPSGLEDRIRARVRDAQRPTTRKFHLMAIAAMIALCIGTWTIRDHLNNRGPLLRAGLGDHVHCAVIAQHEHPADGSVELPARFAGLVPLVKEHIPAGLPLVLAHECRFQGRRYVHLSFRGEHGLLSIAIARKQDGDSLGSGIRTLAADGYQIAATESHGYLVYSASDLPGDANRALLAALTPSLTRFLERA